VLEKLITYWKLGLLNLLRVALYRYALASGNLRSKLSIGKEVEGPFFDTKDGSPSWISTKLSVPPDAGLLLDGKLRFFSRQIVDVADPPDWFANQTNRLNNSCAKHWTLLSDFDAGDIKLVWEKSRFHWLVLAGQAFRAGGSKNYILLINLWLADWSKKNPVNQGPNWKCGQETSIRLMNLLLTSFLLGEFENPSNAFVQLIKEHCERIYPTLHYAIAQDNNHGTSEMAALFIGGAWLISVGISEKNTRKWLHRGRRGLEERTHRLVLKDGSFSQHSINYHRLFLDTISLVEFWRLKLNQPDFSDNYYSSVKKSIGWLWQMTDPQTGNTPNLGANDGAMLLQLTGTTYRDFRPSLQLAGTLFSGKRFYSHEEADTILDWLEINFENIPVSDKNPESCLMDDGGYATLIGEGCWGVVSFPRFRFRPSHADLMHLEVLDRGVPVVCDGGTYSYNTNEPWLNYFQGVESHNTVQFDDDEPMPKLRRFLLGAWPEAKNVALWEESGSLFWEGQYTDYRGCTHSRIITLKGRKWKITDQISGFKHKAILRWRLSPSDWRFDDQSLRSAIADLNVDTEKTKIERMELVEGWESLYYNEKTKIPVLEVEVTKPGLLHTTILLKDLASKSV